MKFILIIIGLVVIVLLCEKYKSHLPTPLKQLYGLWERFAHLFGTMMSTVILTLFWILAIGIYAIVTKCIVLFRRHPKTETYWIPAEPQTTESMNHQF